MINRIRDIRKAKGLTLAELAEACDPPTTAQTIGRLETGMRNLSLKWMDRIGRALGVDPETLVRSDESPAPSVVAELGANGAEALRSPREALLPTDLAEARGEALAVIEVTASTGEYRPGDRLWLRRIAPEEAGRAINRDCLVPRPGGRFAFGRLIDRQGTMIGLLPPGSGQKQLVVDNPPWIGLAVMLVRAL
ncbi:DNA-binding transcriptional regulator, XRE-family HTH domain [Erythrobacter litoralis]|jgi:transcriptional regulator with XRE-family HTH domain|uniref:XRE family transcriptional regulator n=1 Tax=Erythrobacter litoralis TaxID=39960 RepID=A0A074N313_9SPHN|nr:helix-turn-helix transcriptional regulator [Erythrobacter litoralis]AOL23958.1 DNA-binding transcriptional regulator, XRE-family HTH domain [Erythrobacter litoralis]KEO98563.1 XRE family transcriptional regulator [Erythrobacter litoralis]MEE4337308.1 helix-turn-helix transcriptional regulator [Erythrobacter sp.]